MRAIRAKLKISLLAHGWRRQETDRFFGTCGWKESRPHQDGALDFLRVERKTFWMEESMTKECTLATMQPWIPCFPSIPGTMQTSPPPSNAGLDLAAVSHTHIVLSSNHTSLRCNDVRRLSLVTTWQHRRARVLRKRFVARSLAAWKRTHLARVVRWTAATCTSMDVVAGVQHVLREGRTGARIASCARL